MLAANLDNTVGLHFYELVFPGCVHLQFVSIEIIFVDDAAGVGDRIVFIGDLRNAEYRIIEIGRTYDGALQVTIPDHVVNDGPVEREIIGKRKTDVLPGRFTEYTAEG